MLQDTQGASAEQLVATGGGDLVDQLNAAASRSFPWAWLLAAALIIVAVAAGVVGVIILVVGIPAVVWLGVKDRSKRKVVAFYEVDGPPALWFEEVVDSFGAMAHAANAWRLTGAGAVVGAQAYKTHAGVSATVSRVAAVIAADGPPHLATNVAVPTVTAGPHSLYFLPDRVLLRSDRRYTDISYAELTAYSDSVPFVEAGAVPRDAQLVGTRWQFMNLKGGPDHRYKDNRQLPLLLYGQLTLTSPGGLQWVIQLSQASPVQVAQVALGQAPTMTVAQDQRPADY